MIYRTPGYTAWCSNCGRTLECRFAKTQREAKQFFKDCDWTFKDEHLCDLCSKEAKP